jgi:hypothetical protein
MNAQKALDDVAHDWREETETTLIIELSWDGETRTRTEDTTIFSGSRGYSEGRGAVRRSSKSAGSKHDAAVEMCAAGRGAGRLRDAERGVRRRDGLPCLGRLGRRQG